MQNLNKNMRGLKTRYERIEKRDLRLKRKTEDGVEKVNKKDESQKSKSDRSTEGKTNRFAKLFLKYKRKISTSI